MLANSNVVISSGELTNIAVAAVAVLGGGGVFGYLRSQRKAGARDAEIDEAVKIVRADPDAKPPKPDLGVRVDQLSTKVDVIVDNMSQNGGSSLRDDVVIAKEASARTEAKVDKVGTTLNQFIGEAREQHAQMWKAINNKADKA